jgi:GT2 family glycosyltransferase
VIVVDNGSTVAESIAFLDGLQGTYTFPLQVLRLDGNRFKEGGRNAAAALAKGTWLKFHDDDNVPKPNELEALSEAMATGNADAISCSLDMFEGEEAPDSSTVITQRIVFLGDGGAAAFIENFMGDTNFIVSRAAFDAVGGFDDPGQHLPADDWIFLAKLRCKGFRVATLPDALVWYRVSSQADELNWIRKEKSPRARVLQLLAGPLASDVRQVLGLAQMTN